jgi:hypothetical protein
MKQESQIQTLDIYHDRFLLSKLRIIVPIKVQIPIFLKPLFSLSRLTQKRHIEQDIDL